MNADAQNLFVEVASLLALQQNDIHIATGNYDIITEYNLMNRYFLEEIGGQSFNRYGSNNYQTIMELETLINSVYSHGAVGVIWQTGGSEGGHVWQKRNESQPYTSDSEKPNNDVIDYILEHTVPTLSFIQYRSMMKSLTQHQDNIHESEYYGNFKDYAIAYIMLKDIALVLDNMNILPDVKELTQQYTSLLESRTTPKNKSSSLKM